MVVSLPFLLESLNMDDTEPCQVLEWDTDFFGRRIAQVSSHRLNAPGVEAVLKWCQSHHIECLYFSADFDDVDTVRLAEDHGFRLVDVRVELRHKISNRLEVSENGLGAPVAVRLCREGDIPVLRAIARMSHFSSRFYFDPGFSKESCHELYDAWIKRSCEGYADAVLVAELNSEPVGYVSCHLGAESSEGRIGLVGVEAKAQGQGVGWQLIASALEWFRQHDAKTVTVVTQARNLASQRLYQRRCFIIRSVRLWYHKWFDLV